MSMNNSGLSKSRIDRMQKCMAGYVDRGEVPGVVSLVSRRGEVEVNALGTLALGGDAPIQRDSIFRIASLTKPVAAVAAMILVEECRLRLDDPVDTFLPELANRRVLKSLDGPLDDTVSANRPITLRDLLTLRMGLGHLMFPSSDFPIQRLLKEHNILQGPPHPQSLPDPDEWIRRVGTLPLMFQPGERWMYDLGLDVVGVLIARAAGQTLETFMQQRIFEPLGMKDTAFHVPTDKIDRFTTSYFIHPETQKLALYDNGTGGDWSLPPKHAASASGLVSTVDDYLAFGLMLLNHGTHNGQRILSRPSVELMTTNQVTPEQTSDSQIILGSGMGWGLGIGVNTERDNIYSVPGRYGWNGGLGTSWYSDPKEGLVGMLFTQRAWSSPSTPDIVQDFWTGVYSAIDD